MLSERQKVVVVDDKYDEIKHFLSALWKKGIPCIYFDGQPQNFPSSPFSGVRIIFLDIVLGTEGTSSDRNKAAPAANIVKHIVGDKPSPYFIVFWTKHQELIDEVLRYLNLDSISPVGYLKLFKKPQLSDNIKTTDEIIKEMDLKFTELGAFEYMLTWENIVEKAAYNFSTNLFSKLTAKGTQHDWSNQVTALMGSLALAYTETSSLNNNTDDVRNAFLMMTDSFKDSLQQTIKLENLMYNTSLLNSPMNLEQIAKINSSLFIDFNPGKQPFLGNVFIINNPDQHLYTALIKNIFISNEKTDNINIAGMIITPACDLANKKYLHNDKDCFRILYGLLIPIQDYNKLKKNLKLGNNQQQALFDFSPFWYPIKNNPYLLVFHFGSLTSLWWSEDEVPDFSFTIKEHLAFDIQSKMANHANRLGNSMLQIQ
jgi:hypothetical protein